jgi:Ca-activated chloride channel homolog
MWDWFSLHWFAPSQLRAYNWIQPIFLYGIAAIPVLFWLRGALHKRSRQLLKITFVNTIPPRTLSSYTRFLFPLTLFLMITMMLIALARPQIIKNIPETTAEAIDIVLMIDISESMAEKDLLPNRLDAAKRVAMSFIKGRMQDRIGLVAFAGEPLTICPLTDDYELLNSFLADISPDLIRTAGTAIGSALAVSVNRLREAQGLSKVIILLSDGDNTFGELEPETVAKLARAFGIKIYAISVGTNTNTTIMTDSTGRQMNLKTTDENVLKQVSNITLGRFFRATDNMALSTIFQEINSLEKIKITKSTSQNIQEYYRVYINWAIVFMLFALFLKAIFVANVLED